NAPPHWSGLVPMMLFWLWVALSSILATNPSIAYPRLLQFTNIIVISILLSWLAVSQQRIYSLLSVIAVSVGLLGSKAAFDFLITGGQFRVQGVGGLMKEQNEFALAMDMAIPMLVGLSYIQERRWLRYVLRAMAIGCMISVIATYSRSGLL